MYSSQAVGFVSLCLISGIITPRLSNSVATREEDAKTHRLFKDGDVIIGGFFSLFYYRCQTLNTASVGHFEAILYTIGEINKDKSLLPNVTLGYDIRDNCGNEIVTARHAYDFATATTMNRKASTCTLHRDCICNVNRTSEKDEPNNVKNDSSTNPVIAIIGTLSSRTAIPLANFLQAVRIPYVGTMATSEKLSSPIYESYFRTIPSDANQAKAFADIIEHFEWRYVGVLAGEGSYGRDGFQALERESIQRKTFCVELLGYIPLNVTTNNEKLRGVLDSLKRRESIKVVVLWGGFSYGEETLRIAVEVEVKDRVWIVSEGIAAQTTETTFSLIPNISSTGIYIGVTLQKRVSEGFLQHLKAKLQAGKRYDEAHIWWKEFWNYVDKNHPSIEHNISSNMTRLDQLLGIAQNDYIVYIIDAIYSIARALDQMLRCKSNYLSSSTRNSTCSYDKETSETENLIEYLRKVEFKGISGKVKFDSSGDPIEANYDILYFNMSEGSGSPRITKNVIGSWHKNSKDHLTIHNTERLWENDRYGGKVPSSTCAEECKPGQLKASITTCCWKCLQCTDGSVSETSEAQSCTECSETQMSNSQRTQCIPLPITNIDWSDTLAVMFTVISILGMLIDVSVFGILWYFRDTPIVTALNKVCTLVLLVGIALCFGMTLLYIIRPSSGLCSVLEPLRYVVYTLCCSALFLKTMQIVHAFNISGLKNWSKAFICSTKRQVIVLVTMIGIEVLLGAVWILIDPAHAQEIIVPKHHVFITCVPFRGTPGKVLYSLMLVYLALVAGCCIYYAFRARNLPANFNEAKHISFSLYIFLLSWITYYPVDYAAEGWYVAVLSGATLLLSSFGLLGCIFAPKLFIIIWHPEKNTVEFLRAEMRMNNINQSSNNSNSVRPADA